MSKAQELDKDTTGESDDDVIRVTRRESILSAIIGTVFAGSGLTQTASAQSENGNNGTGNGANGEGSSVRGSVRTPNGWMEGENPQREFTEDILEEIREGIDVPDLSKLTISIEEAEMDDSGNVLVEYEISNTVFSGDGKEITVTPNITSGEKTYYDGSEVTLEPGDDESNTVEIEEIPQNNAVVTIRLELEEYNLATTANIETNADIQTPESSLDLSITNTNWTNTESADQAELEVEYSVSNTAVSAGGVEKEVYMDIIVNNTTAMSESPYTTVRTTKRMIDPGETSTFIDTIESDNDPVSSSDWAAIMDAEAVPVVVKINNQSTAISDSTEVTIPDTDDEQASESDDGGRTIRIEEYKAGDKNYIVEFDPRSIPASKATQIPDDKLYATVEMAINRDEVDGRTFQQIGDRAVKEFSVSERKYFGEDDFNFSDKGYDVAKHPDSGENLSNILPKPASERANENVGGVQQETAMIDRTEMEFRIRVFTASGSIDKEVISGQIFEFAQKAGLGRAFGTSFGIGEAFS